MALGGQDLPVTAAERCGQVSVPKERCRAAIIAAARASSRSIGEGGVILCLAAGLALPS